MQFIHTLILAVMSLVWLGFSQATHQSTTMHKTHDDGSEIEIRMESTARGQEVSIIQAGVADTFDFSHMLEGDIEEHTLSSGTPMTVTRNRRGLALEIDDSRFDLPLADDHHSVFVVGSHGQVVLDTAPQADVIRIQGLGDLTQSQRQAVIDAIRAQGETADVVFSDHPEDVVWIESDGAPHRRIRVFSAKSGNRVIELDDDVGDRVITKELEIH